MAGKDSCSFQGNLEGQRERERETERNRERTKELCYLAFFFSLYGTVLSIKSYWLILSENAR
jgi:hypothetical protein